MTSVDRQVAKVLLVDDRPDNLLALEAMLQGLPVEPVVANGGEEALKQLLVEDFALILLDAQMPEMDGFETARHIKRRERTRHIPIIFLTAADRDARLALRGYAAGAVDYLTKPFDPWILRAKVTVFVDMYVQARQIAKQADQMHRLTVAARSALEALETGDAAYATAVLTDATAAYPKGERLTVDVTTRPSQSSAA